MDDRPSTPAHARVALHLMGAVAAALLLAGCGAADADPVDLGTPSATAAPSAGATSAPPSDPAPAPEASESTTAQADAGSGTATVTDLAAAALTPDALPDPSSGWVWATIRDSAAQRPSARLFDPCQPTSYPTDAQRTEARVRDLRIEDDRGEAPETALLRQNIARFPDADVATEAFDGFLRVAQECATSTDEYDLRSSTEVVDDAGPLLLQTTPEMGLTTTYTIVAQRDDVVTVVAYSPGEVRDADTRAQRIAELVVSVLDDAG